jgi:hypothetical protein
MKLLKAASMYLLAGLLGTNALAMVEVNGVRFEDTTELHGSKLLLNGAGTRYKGPFKVYAAGLYLGQKATSLDEVVNVPGPKRLTVTMLRSIDARELGKLLTRGIEDNMGKTEMSKLVTGLVRMGEMFASHKTLAAGDQFLVDWVPGQGSVITVRGQVQGDPFKEPEFFRALMSIWLGPTPAYWKLKDELLGVKTN